MQFPTLNYFIINKYYSNFFSFFEWRTPNSNSIFIDYIHWFVSVSRAVHGNAWQCMHKWINKFSLSFHCAHRTYVASGDYMGARRTGPIRTQTHTRLIYLVFSLRYDVGIVIGWNKIIRQTWRSCLVHGTREGHILWFCFLVWNGCTNRFDRTFVKIWQSFPFSTKTIALRRWPFLIRWKKKTKINHNNIHNRETRLPINFYLNFYRIYMWTFINRMRHVCVCVRVSTHETIESIFFSRNWLWCVENDCDDWIRSVIDRSTTKCVTK